MTTVLTFGTFDVLHEGHRAFLQQAKKYGDCLVVIVARDSNVKKLKGFLPQENEHVRLKKVTLVPIVDCAALGDEELGNRFRWLDEFKPEVICVGYDQDLLLLEQELAQRASQTKIIRLAPYAPEKYKSSKIRKMHSTQ